MHGWNKKAINNLKLKIFNLSREQELLNEKFGRLNQEKQGLTAKIVIEKEPEKAINMKAQVYDIRLEQEGLQKQFAELQQEKNGALQELSSLEKERKD